MKKFNEVLKEQLENPEFKKEYDALEPEYQVIREMIRAREEYNLYKMFIL